MDLTESKATQTAAREVRDAAVPAREVEIVEPHEREQGCHHSSLAIGGSIRADFWEGDATKHFSVKKGFSVKTGEAIE